MLDRKCKDRRSNTTHHYGDTPVAHAWGPWGVGLVLDDSWLWTLRGLLSRYLRDDPNFRATNQSIWKGLWRCRICLSTLYHSAQLQGLQPWFTCLNDDPTVIRCTSQSSKDSKASEERVEGHAHLGRPGGRLHVYGGSPSDGTGCLVLIRLYRISRLGYRSLGKSYTATYKLLLSGELIGHVLCFHALSFWRRVLQYFSNVDLTDISRWVPDDAGGRAGPWRPTRSDRASSTAPIPVRAWSRPIFRANALIVATVICRYWFACPYRNVLHDDLSRSCTHDG